jgi:hypothetical protein
MSEQKDPPETYPITVYAGSFQPTITPSDGGTCSPGDCCKFISGTGDDITITVDRDGLFSPPVVATPAGACYEVLAGASGAYWISAGGTRPNGTINVGSI